MSSNRKTNEHAPVPTALSFEEYLLGDDFDDLKVVSQKRIRKRSDLEGDSTLTSQLEFIVNIGGWARIQTIEDCFQNQLVDNGIVFFMEVSSPSVHLGESLFYWLGYFGGNPIAYLLRRSDHDSAWQVVIENCDSDFIWRDNMNTKNTTGLAETSIKQFSKAVKKAVLGDKYCEEEDG